MPHYRSVGSIPPKRHTQHPRPADEASADRPLYFEELMGEEGFSSQSALLYHRSIPSAVEAVRPWDPGDYTLTPNHPLLARKVDHRSLRFDADADVVTARRLLLANSDCRLSYVVARSVSPWYRNAIGDECVYIERGHARLDTVLGKLDCVPGDYVVIPRALNHRWTPLSDEVAAIVIEVNSHIVPPKRYLSKTGQFLEHSPYCERDLRLCQGPLLAEDLGEDPNAPTEVYIKHRVRGAGQLGIGGSVHTLPAHPLDVVGWDGCLYPFAFNVADFEPITGRIHQPPPVHQVFEAHGLVICNFVPRKVDYHPMAVPVPYYHSNVDSDEVMFYLDGDYVARGGAISAGSISLHPGGHPHGPQALGITRSLGASEFDELALMVDTFAPLDLGEGALAVEDPAYHRSWSASKN